MLVRLGLGLPLGIAVTLALFVLMSQLIRLDAKLDEEEAIKIADITMPDTKIEAKVDEEKPDKPDEVEEPPPEMQQQDIDVDAPTDALSLADGLGKFQPEVSSEGNFISDSDFIPIYVPTPRYPNRAMKSGKEGYAVIECIVTTTGGVRDVKLVEEYPENYGFGRESLKAGEKLKFNPRVVDGVAQESPGILYKFTFKMPKDKRGRR